MPKYVTLEKQASAPTPPHDGESVKLYADSDAALHTIDSEGSTAAVGGEGGDGSLPEGVLTSDEVTFEETAGAGTYTAALDILAGSVVAGVLLYQYGVWDADTVTFTVEDDLSGDAHAYFDAYDLSGTLPGVYVVTSPSGFSLSSDTLTNDGAQMAAVALMPAAAQASVGVRYDEDTTLALTLVTTGSGGTSGRLTVKILYFSPVTAVAAVKS